MSFAEFGAAAIAAGIDDMYAAFLAGDRKAFDAHLHDDVTTWETHLPGPLRTRRELDSYRETRDAAGERPVLDVMAATEKRIDVWGDTGVARYVLVTRDAASGEEQHTRVTDVLRCLDGSWRIVHHHAELVRP
ncbi:nuclear transport factor 2 family protein [Paractinoplanes hotanensis]|uniref:Nuclear transport factor 2 family protein n=1 Tax=Paractinoplanes hotanensis TaxID=2906497 RepID=A0ABT0Y9H3_9ACTN|nr:nuclear transport factor 2 family protein [Actinoplanes hotanensis]MCM4082694.1 nuclear transport factor 2 family protein [Actinoplanes hotanensis]